MSKRFFRGAAFIELVGVVVIALILATVFAIGIGAVGRSDAQRPEAACEARGGTPLLTYDGSLFCADAGIEVALPDSAQ